MKTSVTGTLLFFLLFVAACKKDHNTHATVCANLINDPIAESDSCFISFPNAFTPNMDGKNDWPVVLSKNIDTSIPHWEKMCE